MKAWVVALLVVLVVVVAGLGIGLMDRAATPDRNELVIPSRPHPRAQAVRVATRFLVGMDAATLLDTEARRSFVARWAGRQAEPQLQRVYDAEAKRMSVLDGGYSRAALLGYRVEHVSAGSAHVAVWAVSLASVGDLPTAVGWQTVVVGLVREDGRWRIADVSETPGPSPDSRPAELREAARQFEEYRFVP
jgi:hypothetical protein